MTFWLSWKIATDLFFIKTDVKLCNSNVNANTREREEKKQGLQASSSYIVTHADISIHIQHCQRSKVRSVVCDTTLRAWSGRRLHSAVAPLKNLIQQFLQQKNKILGLLKHLWQNGDYRSPHKKPCGCFAIQANTHTFSPGFRWESEKPRAENRNEARSLPSPAPLSEPAGSLASPPPLFPVLSATAAVWVEQLCVGTHTVCSSGWMVALHCSSLCPLKGLLFHGGNTGLIHRAQWDCSRFLSIMRERVRGAGVQESD